MLKHRRSRAEMKSLWALAFQLHAQGVQSAEIALRTGIWAGSLSLAFVKGKTPAYVQLSEKPPKPPDMSACARWLLECKSPCYNASRCHRGRAGICETQAGVG